MQLLLDVLALDWVDGLDWALPRLLPPKGSRGPLPGVHLTRLLGATRYYYKFVFDVLTDLGNTAIAELTSGLNDPPTNATNLWVTMQRKSGTALIWRDKVSFFLLFFFHAFQPSTSIYQFCCM